MLAQKGRLKEQLERQVKWQGIRKLLLWAKMAQMLEALLRSTVW